MQGTNVTIYEAQSDSSRDTYEVRFFEDGTVKCSCPASTFRGYTACKHIQRLRGQGARYQAPKANKVFTLVYGASEVVVTEDKLEATIKSAIERLDANKELTVKRLA